MSDPTRRNPRATMRPMRRRDVLARIDAHMERGNELAASNQVLTRETQAVMRETQATLQEMRKDMVAQREGFWN